MSSIYNLDAMNAVPQDSGESVIFQLLRRVAGLERDNEQTKEQLRSMDQAIFGNISFIVPSMTGYSQDGYEVSASSEYPGYGYNHYCAYHVTQDNDNIWTSRPGNVVDSWIRVKLPFPKISNVVMLSARKDQYINYTPDVFDIQASNDGVNFSTLRSVKVKWLLMGRDKVFFFKNSEAYLFYQILVKKAQHDNNNEHSGFSRVNFGVFETE